MNMNEALQQSLYDKLSREQDKYRDWLKGQPPEEILHHSYTPSSGDTREPVHPAPERFPAYGARGLFPLQCPAP